MLSIRPEQMAVFSASLRKRFETEMAAHLETFFPKPCARMGPEELAVFIRRTVDKALAYGIERERDVCKFLDVAMALGQDFDHDPQHSWAREILTDASLVGQEKIGRLVKAALEIVEHERPPQ
jgi:hypothetical protein